MNQRSPDSLLRQLSGLATQDWDNGHTSTIILPSSYASPSKTLPGPPIAASTPKADRGLHGDDITLESNGVLEDSGYESPTPKQPPRFLDSSSGFEATTFHTRTSSAPMPQIRASRIPISTSTTKIGLKRSANWRSAELLRLAHPKLNDAAFGDQRGCQGQRPPATAPPSSSHRALSRSVSSLRNYGAARNVTKTELEMKMPQPHPQPRFVRSRSAAPPPFPSPCLSTGQFPCTPAIRLPSYHTMLGASESFQAIKAMVDKNVHEILQDGQQEFDGKYSDWIQQVFNLQLEKIHGRLRQVYTQKLKGSLEEKERQVLEMKTTYRSKLLEFEEATKKFQGWYDEVIRENQKQVAANELLMKQLKEKEANLRREYAAETASKLIQLEETFESERQLDLTRHAEQLKQIGKKGEAQKQLVVDQYQHQVDALKAQLESSKNHNAALHEKYAEQRKVHAQTQADLNHNDEPILEDELHDPEREEMRGQIRALEMEVEKLMINKQEMSMEHSEEVIKLQKTLELNNQKIRVLVKETRQEIESIRSERERGIREMTVKIRAKEEEHRRELSLMTERYGKKIEELTSSVQLLTESISSGGLMDC